MKHIVKQFVILLVLMGCLPAVLRAQCPPSPVKCMAGDNITLGTPDPKAGSKVCYKWSSSDCSSCIVSDINQPVIQVHIPDATEDNTYHFTRTKIGESVETCIITVNAEATIEIVSITPKKQCYTEGDPISEADFIIVTDPAGLEGNVRLDANSKTAACSAVSGTTCDQTLTFNAYKGTEIKDTKTSTTTVYRSEGGTVSNQTEIPDAVQDLVNKINAAKPVVNAINGGAEKLAALLNKIPGLPFSFSADPLTINANIGQSYDICCKGYTGQSKTFVTISGTAGVKASISYPVNLLGPPPFTLLPPQLKLVGQVGLSVTAGGTVSVNTCDETALDIDLAVALRLAGGVEWGKEADFLYGSATLFVEPSLQGTWHVYPFSNFGCELHGKATLGANLKGKVNAGWFKSEANVDFIFGTLQLF